MGLFMRPRVTQQAIGQVTLGISIYYLEEEKGSVEEPSVLRRSTEYIAMDTKQLEEPAEFRSKVPEWRTRTERLGLGSAPLVGLY